MKMRRCPKIQTCPRCGRMRIHHPGAMLYECPVDDEVIEALKAWRSSHGKAWKAKLSAFWLSGKDEGALRRARNVIGPNDLYKIDLDNHACTTKKERAARLADKPCVYCESPKGSEHQPGCPARQES